MNKRLANKAKKLKLFFRKIDKYLWYDGIVKHLRNSTKPNNEKIQKLHVLYEKNYLKIRKDTIIDKS